MRVSSLPSWLQGSAESMRPPSHTSAEQLREPSQPWHTMTEEVLDFFFGFSFSFSFPPLIYVFERTYLWMYVDLYPSFLYPVPFGEAPSVFVFASCWRRTCIFTTVFVECCPKQFMWHRGLKLNKNTRVEGFVGWWSYSFKQAKGIACGSGGLLFSYL